LLQNSLNLIVKCVELSVDYVHWILDLTLATTLLQTWLDDFLSIYIFYKVILTTLFLVSLVDMLNLRVNAISLVASLLLLTADMIVVLLWMG